MLRQAGIFSIGCYQQPSTPQLKRPREAWESLTPVIPQNCIFYQMKSSHTFLPTHLDFAIFQASRQLSGHACKAHLLPWRLKTLIRRRCIFESRSRSARLKALLRWLPTSELRTHTGEGMNGTDQSLNTAARPLASIPAAVTPTTDYQVNVVLINQKWPTLPFQKGRDTFRQEVGTS